MSKGEAEGKQDAPASEEKREHSSAVLKSGIDAAEAGRRSGAARRARAAERQAAADDAAFTSRQRLGLALSQEMTTEDWAAVVRQLKQKGDSAGLARLHDQAFGKPTHAEEEEPEEGVAHLTKAQRSAMIARLLEEEEGHRAPALDPSDPRE